MDLINILFARAFNNGDTKEYVDEAIAALKGEVNTDLDTLEELSRALGNDPDFFLTIKKELDEKITQEELDATIAEVESSRTEAENERKAAEASRIDAELARESAEIARASAESARVQAENSRQSAEATRVTDEQDRASMESKRVAAENERVSAEASRIESETKRANAESMRVSAEQGRVIAESERVLAENERAATFSGYRNEITALSVQIADIKGYLSLTEDYILGLQVDYKNKTYTRIAGAKGLNAGDDFDRFSMYGGRKRCTVADDGTITSFYGDENYVEDGSIGQVMVYQPKFYYMIMPIDLDPIEDGKGYHLRKANYYVCDRPETGFKLHPAFYDKDGNEVDYVLIGAYEGSIYDNSTSSYLLLDEQVMTASEDKFCSIAGAKPASGLTQNLTRPNIESMAQNRGTNWHLENSKIASMEQLLCMIEMGSMNTQSTIGQGVVSISDNSSYNCSSLTGSTSSLGNRTGMATETINEKGGETTTETANGKVSISYRGVENDWGNIWKFTIDPNIYGDGTLKGGEPYYCTNFNFAENKNSDNYKGAGFTVANTSGYISAMGYSNDCDWLFMASETLGNSSLPVGDYTYVTTDLNGYRISRLGGFWTNGGSAGGFDWALTAGVGTRSRYVGGRLVYVPNSGK